MGAMYETPSEITDARIEDMCRIEAEYRRNLLIGKIVLGIFWIAALCGAYYFFG